MEADDRSSVVTHEHSSTPQAILSSKTQLSLGAHSACARVTSSWLHHGNAIKLACVSSFCLYFKNGVSFDLIFRFPKSLSPNSTVAKIV